MHVHQVRKRKFKREKAHREAMIKNLASSVILYEKVKTTEAKAKEVKRIIDKLINIGKKDNLSAKRRILAYLPQKEAVDKILKELKDIYGKRNSGYSRIIKLGQRSGDGARMVQIELLDVGLKKKKEKTEKKPLKDKNVKKEKAQLKTSQNLKEKTKEKNSKKESSIKQAKNKK